MKLTDLRSELNTRAESTDETPDLLSGVHRKITQTKRRRKAGALGAVGGVAVIAAIASGIFPGLTSTTPQPADDVPKDYVKDGLILHAFNGTDRLEKGFIGDPGQSVLDFSWTPKSRTVRFAALCRTDGSAQRNFAVEVNGRVIGTSDCRGDQDVVDTGITVPADSTMWLTTPLDQAAHVIVRLADENYRPVRDPGTQIALGIYRTTDTPVDGPPTQAPPTSPDDYVKDGIRYRAKVGGDTLLGAKVADRGKSSLEFDFTAPSGPISFHTFCTAFNPSNDSEYRLSIKLNGAPLGASGCSDGSTDAAKGSSYSKEAESLQAGERVKATVTLEDEKGRPVSMPNDWIGVGIYAKGKQRAVDNQKLDEVVEYSGRNYRLVDLKTAPFATTDHLEMVTPADTPFLVSHGGSGNPDGANMVHLTGLSSNSDNAVGGYGTSGEAARPAGTAKVSVTGPHQSTGHLFLALYLPE